MLKRIAIIGPESTGKSTLAADLAARLGTVSVPEYARDYIDGLERPYEYEDLLEIARGQVEMEDSLANSAKGVLVVDTTLTVIRVWSMYKYGKCDSWIMEEEQRRKYDLTLVCDIDLPWEYDPQREHPHLRQHFFNIYRDYALTCPMYAIISGEKDQRITLALKSISQLNQRESR